jgi:FkbM family methyltransferase
MIGLTVHGVRKNKTATRLTTEKKFQATTAQNLLDSGKAIKAHIHSKNPSIPMVFDMLVFPLSIDKVISRDIVEKEMYEPEMSQFIHLALTTTTTTNQAGQVFAVDIGANVGFHTLHMAYLGAQVIALEPAPDTGDLLRGSLELNPSFLVTLVRAAAAEAPGHGQLSRHPDSPGLTTLASTADLPKEWNLKQMDGEANHNQATDVSATSSTIPLVMAKDVLNRHGVPNLDTQQLVLLKVDAEGFELQALRGLDLSAFPFRFLALEFFPLLIQGSGVQDPIDLLVFLSDHGYHCSLGSFDATQLLKRDRRQWQEWVDQNGIMTSHVNLYCERKGDET